MDRRCKYASKPYSNARSLKDNGDLHHLCEFHRDKANIAQRRWYTRKATSDKAVGIKDEKLQKKPRQRKATAGLAANANAVVVAAPSPRKRGRVTFRDALITSVVMTGAHSPCYNSAPVPLYVGSFQEQTLLPQLYEPLAWKEMEISTSTAFLEPAKLDYNWPVPVPTTASPTDTAWMATGVFDMATADGDFYSTFIV